MLVVAASKINGETLLAEMGTTAPNVGFSIKGAVVAEYLSIFRLPEHEPPKTTPLNARELAAKGRNFTVQVVCQPE